MRQNANRTPPPVPGLTSADFTALAIHYNHQWGIARLGPDRYLLYSPDKAVATVGTAEQVFRDLPQMPDYSDTAAMLALQRELSAEWAEHTPTVPEALKMGTAELDDLLGTLDF